MLLAIAVRGTRMYPAPSAQADAVQPQALLADSTNAWAWGFSGFLVVEAHHGLNTGLALGYYCPGTGHLPGSHLRHAGLAVGIRRSGVPLNCRTSFPCNSRQIGAVGNIRPRSALPALGI